MKVLRLMNWIERRDKIRNADTQYCIIVSPTLGISEAPHSVDASLYGCDDVPMELSLSNYTNSYS